MYLEKGFRDLGGGGGGRGGVCVGGELVCVRWFWGEGGGDAARIKCFFMYFLKRKMSASFLTEPVLYTNRQE